VAAPPEFVSGRGVDAVAEFRDFLIDQRDLAAHLLAELTGMQTCNLSESIPKADQTTSVRDLYCRRVSGWCVFYTLASPQLPSTVTVLHVVREASGPFSALETEAERRLR